MAKDEGSSKKKHKKQHQEDDPSSSKSASKKHKKHKQKQDEQQQSTPSQPSAPPPPHGGGSSSEHKHKEKKNKKKHHHQQQQQQQDQQQQQPAPDSKVKKRKKQQDEEAAQKKPHKKHKQADEHLTVNIQVPSAAAGSSKKATSKQHQQQQVASAGPWLVYMAAPDPSVYSKLQFKAYVPGSGGAAAGGAGGGAGGRGGQQQQQQGMVLVSEQEGTTLIGSTRSSINEPAAQFGSYAVGVFDKRSNTLQLAQPAGGSVVRVEALASQAGPVEVAALSRAAQHSMLEQHQQQQRQPERDAAARRAEAVRLVEAFGSTRRKRQLQARAEGTVVVQQNAAAAELDVLMQEVQARAAAAGDTREEIMGRLAANRVIPVHNPLATTPQEAYQPRLMFGEALMSAVNMGQMLHAAENADDADKLKTKVPAYVVQRLQRIREAGSNQAERKRRARLLALLAALIRLATARPKLVERPPQPAVPASAEGAEGGAEGGGEGGSTAAARPARPGGLEGLAASLRIGRQQVLELLLDKFYDKRLENGRVTWVREAKQEQLMMMHLLVVALDLEGWRMAPQQFELLRRELKTTPQDLVSRFRELGCSSAAVRIQAPSEDASAAAGSKAETTSSYNITLLASGDKNLAQSFPRPKVMKKQGAR